MCDEECHLHCKIISRLAGQWWRFQSSVQLLLLDHLPMLGPPMQWLVQTVVDPSKFKIPADAYIILLQECRTAWWKLGLSPNYIFHWSTTKSRSHSKWTKLAAPKPLFCRSTFSSKHHKTQVNLLLILPCPWRGQRLGFPHRILLGPQGLSCSIIKENAWYCLLRACTYNQDV